MIFNHRNLNVVVPIMFTSSDMHVFLIGKSAKTSGIYFRIRFVWTLVPRTFCLQQAAMNSVLVRKYAESLKCLRDSNYWKQKTCWIQQKSRGRMKITIHVGRGLTPAIESSESLTKPIPAESKKKQSKETSCKRIINVVHAISMQRAFH